MRATTIIDAEQFATADTAATAALYRAIDAVMAVATADPLGDSECFRLAQTWQRQLRAIGRDVTGARGGQNDAAPVRALHA